MQPRRPARGSGDRPISERSSVKVWPQFLSLAGTLPDAGALPWKTPLPTSSKRDWNAVGFIARPVGAAIFGHFGDRVGRKSTLIATLLLMGLATFAAALVPTCASIGIWGAVILTVLRFIQGVGVYRCSGICPTISAARICT